MNSTQTMKEVRQLAWPWTILTAAGLLILAGHGSLPSLDFTFGIGGLRLGPPLLHSLTDWILPAGAFFGTVLLATLPLGSEFQYRTLPMRMAQPAQRGALWNEKFLITIAAVAPVGAIYCAALYLRFGGPFALMAGVWIVVAAAGAIPCTLVARSTIGGMVLVNFGTSLITIGWTYYERHKTLPAALLIPLSLVLAAYVVVMIWLGRRMILRYQAADGMQAGETFVPGAQLVPQVVVEWFRCRPTQPIANLVRREFRLLRVLWPMAVIYVAAWIYLVAGHQLPDERPESLHVVFVLTVILGAILAVLAGTLSLGEEKTWGTHQWHMTLPISASTQWFVKLSVALLASVVCVALIPMLILLAGGQVGDAARHFLDGTRAVAWIAQAAGITFASFWCSCAVQGTVQATLWVFPLCFSIWIVTDAAPLVMSAITPALHMVSGKLLWHLDIVSFPINVRPVLDLLFGREYILVLALLPVFAVALIQSRRAFRGQATANKLRVLRYALPLMAVSFALSLTAGILITFMIDGLRQEDVVLRETTVALASIASADAANGGLRGRQVSVADLEKVAPVSDWTEHWLRNAKIILGPAPEKRKGRGVQLIRGEYWVLLPRQPNYNVPFSAVVRARTGTECSLTYEPPRPNVTFAIAICQPSDN